MADGLAATCRELAVVGGLEERYSGYGPQILRGLAPTAPEGRRQHMPRQSSRIRQGGGRC